MRKRDLFSKFLRYFVTGGIAAIVDAGGFALLNQIGSATVPSAITSFIVAAYVNFRLTSRFVFAQRASGRRFSLFLLAAVLGLMINVGITVGAVTLFGWRPLVAKVLGIGVAFSINFMMNVCFVFGGGGRKFLIRDHRLRETGHQRRGSPSVRFHPGL